jgi:hypothetical protein
MRSAAATPVWTTSFLDLCLVLLGFFVMLHAVEGHRAELVAGLNTSFGAGAAPRIEQHRLTPHHLFQPGEALFRPGAQVTLIAIGREAARTRAHVSVESIGIDAATNRFDGWELAAARTAAVARAIRSGGLSDRAIEIAIPGSTGAPPARGQQIMIAVTPPEQ